MKEVKEPYEGWYKNKFPQPICFRKDDWRCICTDVFQLLFLFCRDETGQFLFLKTMEQQEY